MSLVFPFPFDWECYEECLGPELEEDWEIDGYAVEEPCYSNCARRLLGG